MLSMAAVSKHGRLAGKAALSFASTAMFRGAGMVPWESALVQLKGMQQQ